MNTVENQTTAQENAGQTVREALNTFLAPNTPTKTRIKCAYSLIEGGHELPEGDNIMFQSALKNDRVLALAYTTASYNYERRNNSKSGNRNDAPKPALTRAGVFYDQREQTGPTR